MYEIDDIIRQLENKELEYDELNKIQMWLCNNNYISFNKLVFRKEALFDEKTIFYMEDEEYIKAVEKGNRRTNYPYCQIVNNALWFYNLDKIREIVLDYTLYDVLDDTRSQEVVEFLIENYDIQKVLE